MTYNRGVPSFSEEFKGGLEWGCHITYRFIGTKNLGVLFFCATLALIKEVSQQAGT